MWLVELLLVKNPNHVFVNNLYNPDGLVWTLTGTETVHVSVSSEPMIWPYYF